jgi:hypothetical protein
MRPLSLFSISLFIVLLISCQEEQQKELPPMNGSVTSQSDCKSYAKSTHDDNTPDSISKVNYIFDSESSTLYMEHINAGFNCCPEEISIQASFHNDTIYIEKSEEAALCNCLCCFDINMEISNVKQTAYTIHFIELYNNALPEISFEVDFTQQTEGTNYVIRHDYPWGVGIY